MTPEQEDAITDLLDEALSDAYEQGTHKWGLEVRGYILLGHIKLLLGERDQ